jgi:hypothetical protein
VRVDPRIELLSIVFRLAGNPEYGNGRVPQYTKAVDAWFGKHGKHAVVRQAAALRRKHGVSYDAVASFAVHLAGIDPPRFAAPLDPRPERLDARWAIADVKSFLANLGDFVAATKAVRFFAGQKDLYAHGEEQMRKVVADHADLRWFATFFGARPTARFQVVLGLNNGGGNYGPSALLPDGNEDLYAILGCWQVDAKGLPRYDRKIVPTLVHEYSHSYCNPVVDAHLAELSASGDALFARVADAMRAQAYAGGRTVLCESLVRACVVRYRASCEGEREAAAEVEEQNGRSFFWTGALAALLAEDYEKRRAEYPTLHEFAPKLVTFFAAAVPELDERFARLPKVVALTPANGQQDVDPATRALVITFDRPMQDRMWAVVGGGEHFPKTTGKPTYDREYRVLTIPIELKPDWDYELWLNRGKFNSFRSQDGTPLAPLKVTFRTRAK